MNCFIGGLVFGGECVGFGVSGLVGVWVCGVCGLVLLLGRRKPNSDRSQLVASVMCIICIHYALIYIYILYIYVCVCDVKWGDTNQTDRAGGVGVLVHGVAKEEAGEAEHPAHHLLS